MIKLLLVVVTTLTLTSLKAQTNYPFDKWKAEDTLAARNAASACSEMTEEEQEVVYLCNLARLQPKLFAETYVKQYVDNSPEYDQSNSYVRSLIRDLSRLKTLSVLESACDLYKVAGNHALISGKKGTIGHQGYDKRYSGIADKYISDAENCDYGSNTAIDIVMSLLIDEGVSSLGHRKNILNETYNFVGVGIRPHKKWDYNAVMSFGRL